MKPLEEMGKFATVVIDPPWPIRTYRLGKERQMTGAPSVRFAITTRCRHDQRDHRIASCRGLAEDALVFCWTVNSFPDDTGAIPCRIMGHRILASL